MSGKIHMRKRRLSILADGCRDKRNFGRERFKNQDIMRRNYRRIEFCGSELEERPVGRSRVHDLHRHIAKKFRMRKDENIRFFKFIGIFGSRLFSSGTCRHIEQSIFRAVQGEEQHPLFNQLIRICHLLGRNIIRREERHCYHGIHRSIIRKRSGYGIFFGTEICFLIENSKRTRIPQHLFRKIKMIQILHRIHKMHFGRIRTKIANDKFHQIARTHFRFGRVRHFAERFIAVLLVKTRVLVIILDKNRMRTT